MGRSAVSFSETVSKDVLELKKNARLAPKVIFLRKSQVKSPKSQVMTLTFFKGRLENTFRRFF